MSKRGNCFDNAPIESFGACLRMNWFTIAIIKQGKKEAKADITKYIELFYNQRRVQKGLDFKTPNQIAGDFYKLAA